MNVNDQYCLLPDICQVMSNLETSKQEQLCYYLIEPCLNEDDEEGDQMNIDIDELAYANQFKNILSIFQQFLSYRLENRSSSSDFSGSSSGSNSNRLNLNSDEVVIDTTKCIAALCKGVRIFLSFVILNFLCFLDRLNEKNKYVHYVEFYNDKVNEKLEIKEDFPNFKDKKG